MESALEDVTVVSFAQLAQGPLATQLLADMGAEVIKIEPPGGERLRTTGAEATDYLDDPSASQIGMNTTIGGENVTFLSLNRNKKSVTLDLKNESDKMVAYDLLEDADVLVENFRPGVMERLGFGYEELSDRNPGLVYASASGYGSSGPFVDKQGQDLIIQGLSGLLSLTGSADDPPTPAGTVVVDSYSAVLLAFGIVTALHHRERTGEGQKVEGNLLSSAIHLLTQEISVLENVDEQPERSEVPGMGHTYLQAPYGVYETADGYLTLSLSPVSAIAEALDLPELAEITSLEEAYKSRDQIKEQIQAELQMETTESWLSLFDDYDIWSGPVNDLEDAVDHPQVRANDMIVSVPHSDIDDLTMAGIPLQLSKTPGSIRSPPPSLGSHTDEIRESVSSSSHSQHETSDQSDRNE